MIRAVLLAAALSTLAFPLPAPEWPSSRPVFTAPQPGQGEIESLAAAWPDRILEAAERDGDWMLRIDSTWFAWAHGRLLPESERSRWKEFAPQAFYDYPRGLPSLPVLDADSAAHLRARVAEDQRHPPRRSEKFLGALLEAPTRATTEARLVHAEVAGYTVTIHERLRGPLSRVSRELDFLRKVNPAVSTYLRQLAEMNGYNYRFVEGTRSRSLHSYGTAIDLIPRGRDVGHSYWQWAMNKVPDWWTIPYEKRWMPPMALVRAFERQGFVWGGKWLYFDTMHFEYRPELLAQRSRAGSRRFSNELDDN